MAGNARGGAGHGSLAMPGTVLAGGVCLAACVAAALGAEQPVAGTIPTSGITGQKPQSKLWHDQATWWAVLPQARGAYLWKFVDGRFQPQETPGALKGTRSNCECDAALVGGTLYILAFQPRGTASTLHALKFGGGAYRLLPGYPVVLKHDAKVETIAFDVDAKGVVWAAWASEALEVLSTCFDPGQSEAGFSSPFVLGKGVGRDDIAAVAAFKGNVGAMWSNSKQQKFYFRRQPQGRREIMRHHKQCGS